MKEIFDIFERNAKVTVAEELTVINGEQSTSIHFVLKKYKDGNIIFKSRKSDDMEAIVL